MKRLLAIAFATALLWAPASAVDIPRKPPNLEFQLRGGRMTSLAQFKGKPVVVEFLLTTCPHCQHASGILEKLYKEYQGRGLQIVGIATNKGAIDLVPEFVGKLHLTYPVGAIDEIKAMDFLQHPSVVIMYMPQLVFIDKDGMIRAQHGGEDNTFMNVTNLEQNFRIEIEKLLTARPAAKPAKTPKAARASAKVEKN